MPMPSATSAEPKRFALGASRDCRTVKVDGVQLAYDDRGHGFPVVGLHAITHGSRDFEYVADRLASRWRLITPDWPGQGRSGADRAACLPRALHCAARRIYGRARNRARRPDWKFNRRFSRYRLRGGISRARGRPRAGQSRRPDSDEPARTKALRRDSGAWTRRPARSVLLQAALLDAVSADSADVCRERSAEPDRRCGR